MSLNVEKNFWQRFSLEISDYQDRDATNKINVVSPHYSARRYNFQIEFLMEKFLLLMAEDSEF